MDARFFSSNKLEVRTAANGDMVLGGYAARYGVVSKMMTGKHGNFREVLAPGAFTDALDDDALDCVALVNHDPSKLLGRTPRTLKLKSDGHGLEFQVDLSPNISHHRDIYEQVRRGDMCECSFGFVAGEDEWDDRGDYLMRTVRSVKSLHDVSIVSNPAYDNTHVGIRSDVDLVEVRSRLETQRHWRQVPVWRRTCGYYQGLDPDTASLEQLVAAIEEEKFRNSAAGRAVVQRRRALTDFLLG
jgi:HK97 family phage prohead protease